MQMPKANWGLRTNKVMQVTGPSDGDELQFKCTYCGNTRFMLGPSGGMSQNITCSNPDCRHRFNDQGPFGIDDLKMVDELFPDDVEFEERMRFAATRPDPPRPSLWARLRRWLP